MRVVLIQPPVRDFYDTDVRLQPIGLAYLKAALRAHLPDVDVIVKDYHGGHGRRTVAIPKELRYLTEYYSVADKSPFSTFHQYYHFGKSFEEIAAEVAELYPDIVGISSLFTPYYREALEVAARVKQRTGAIVVMGGSHASAVPESLLQAPVVDYVIRGEGERPLVELVRALRSGKPLDAVPNLAYKRQGELVFNAIEDNYPIDELPIPDVGDFAPASYTLAGKPMTFMITSRSCPHRCSFCSVHTTFGTEYRRRGLEEVLEEIELRYEQGYRVIDFEDDNLTYYKPTFKELCRRLIQRFPNREMQFVAMNGISYLSLDDELLELMQQAGFTHLNLALVSSDKTVRETTKRPHTLAAYVRVVDKAHALGFNIVSYQILGLPSESLDSMVQTLAFNARLPVLLGASPFYRTPRSPIARDLEPCEADFIKARLTALGVECKHFGRGDIYTLFVTTRIVNFLKSLTVDHPSDLQVLLKQKWPEPRTQLGCDLLTQMAASGVLFSSTTQGLVPNRNFCTALFARVLCDVGTIRSQTGATISVRGFGQRINSFRSHLNSLTADHIM